CRTASAASGQTAVPDMLPTGFLPNLVRPRQRAARSTAGSRTARQSERNTFHWHRSIPPSGQSRHVRRPVLHAKDAASTGSSAIEPGVLKAPAVVIAVDHHRVALEVGLPA